MRQDRPLDWVCQECHTPFETGDVILGFGSDDHPRHFRCVYARMDRSGRDILRALLSGRGPITDISEGP